jgi:hypothetical protein
MAQFERLSFYVFDRLAPNRFELIIFNGKIAGHLKVRIRKQCCEG